MLQPGDRVGPYEVLSPLGAGGMGEVYRARDTTLGRNVALKTLPAELVSRPDRLARLRREARILASLNHPGIATLHGLEEREGTPVLVMEVVEGETLSDRLRRGPLPLKDALLIGQQIAEAMAVAHEKGVLHRDLKPANVRLTKAGHAKVLDFGLAVERGRGGGSGSAEPPVDSVELTDSSPVSRPGGVLGTAPYMSPEQLLGRELDARTDVWSFGCLLFEMLTGKRAFPSTTGAEASTAIVERDPDFDALPTSTPVALQRLLRRCLRRDKQERLHDIADAGLELRELLTEISSGTAVVTMGSGGGKPLVTRLRQNRGPLAAVGLLVFVAALGLFFAIGRLRRDQPVGDARQPRFEVTLPRDVALPPIGWPQNPLALSPDGRQLVFVGCGGGACRLYLRDRAAIDARPLAGTEGVRAPENPFFSPDGRWIGFGADGKLKKVALEGGVPQTIADAPQFRGGSWGEDGTILLNRGRGGLVRVSADGGEVEEVTKPGPGEYDHRWPQHMPGGRAALFDVTSDVLTHAVAIVDLETGRTRILERTAGSPRWSPTGHLLFGRGGITYAAPLDLRRLELTGPSVPVLDGVAMFNSPGQHSTSGGNVYYAVASEGSLVYSPREAQLPKRTLVWLDRQGKRTPIVARRLTYLHARLSPDGNRLAVDVDEGPGLPGAHLVLDLQREAWTKVALEDEAAVVEARIESWMPDGNQLLMRVTTASQSRIVLAQVDGSGAETLHVGMAEFIVPSPDGQAVLFCSQSAPAQWDIWRLPLDGERKPVPFLVTPKFEVSPTFSPDGRFVAYWSNDSGRAEVYVRPYPGPGPHRMVSTHGGAEPLWSRDGREIVFGSGGALVSATVRTAPTFASEPPRKLFDVPDEIMGGMGLYDVAADGQRFVMIERDPVELRPLSLVIVPSWIAELQAKMAAASGTSRTAE